MRSILSKYRRKLLTTLAVIFVLVIILCVYSRQYPNPKEMPDTMKELSQEESVEWMAGMWVELPNYPLYQSDSAPGVDVYSCTESAIRVIVTVQNGLDKAQPYYLMVLADGVPVEYSIGEKTYQTYSFDLTKKQTAFELELQPDFSLNLGRLDFLLCFNGNPQSDFHITSYTIWLKQDGPMLTPTGLQNTTKQREGVKGSFNEGAYGAWLWEANTLPADTDHTGPREIITDGREQLLFEAITSKAGVYRTVLIIDGQPVSFTTDEDVQLSWLDWESNGTDMLQIPIELSGDYIKDGSFFTVTTPLGTESLPLSSLVSFKIQVVDSQVGEE